MGNITTYTPVTFTGNTSTTTHTVPLIYGNQTIGQGVLGGPYNQAGNYVGPLNQPILGQGNFSWQQAAVASQPNYYLPQPTGFYTSVRYADPQTGNIQILYIDNAYTNILNQIMTMQGVPAAAYTPTPQHHKLPDSEFSLDELENAETIIWELEHETAKGVEAP